MTINLFVLTGGSAAAGYAPSVLIRAPAIEGHTFLGIPLALAVRFYQTSRAARLFHASRRAGAAAGTPLLSLLWAYTDWLVMYVYCVYTIHIHNTYTQCAYTTHIHNKRPQNQEGELGYFLSSICSMFTQVASRSSRSFLSSTVNTSATNRRPCFLGAYSTLMSESALISLMAMSKT